MSIAKMDFLVCYDISDKKRLSRVARVVEKYAMRIQRSVYFYEQVSKAELDIFVKKIASLVDEKRDDIRIYTIKDKGLALGKAMDLDNPLIIV
jgi:CRISPR-associated protein Cas2